MMEFSATTAVHTRRFPFFLTLIALVVSPTLGADAGAQEKRELRANDLYRIRTASEVAISPEGRYVAFVVTRIDSTSNRYQRHIWIADLEENEVRQYTRGDVRDRAPTWSPDGSKLAFVSDRGEGASQIYLLPRDGGEARAVTDLERDAQDPVWSPDGERLYFRSTLPDHELVARNDAGGEARSSDPIVPDTAMWGSMAAIRNWLAVNALENDPAVITRLDFQGETELNPEERWSHVYVLDIDAGEPHRLTGGRHDYGRPAVSPDGQSIAFVAVITDSIHPDYVVKRDLYVMNADGTGRRRLAIPTHTVLEARWSPDGDRLAFAARDTSELSAANTEIGVIDSSGEDSTIWWVSRPLDRGARTFRWSPDGDQIYFSANVHGTVPIYRAKVGDGEVRQIVSGERGILDFDLEEDRLAYVVTEPSDPSEVYAADRDGDDERRITDLNTGWLAGIELRPHRGFWYESFDGRRVQGWLIEPVGLEEDRTYPLAVEIHGGPHVMWGPGEATMWHEFQLLAANGYFVLYTNPRGSGGYGYDFKAMIQRDWGDGPMRDILTAVDSVVARGSIDSTRMVVTGGSYAGYLTAYLVGHDHRFQAAVAQRGVYDLGTFFGEGNAWRLVPYEFDTYPWEAPALLRQQSPLTYAHRIRTPLLIMHADRDLRTGVSQSEMLYRTLMVLKKRVEYVRYPREGHDLSRTGEPKHRIDRLLRILEFFDRHMPEETAPKASP